MPKNKGNRSRDRTPLTSPGRAQSALPSPARHLGQHFLTDVAIATRIVDALDPDCLSEIPVLEIGPGRMILSRLLARRSRHLILLEKDRRLLPALEEAFGAGSSSRSEACHVEILCDDALTAPFDLWTFPYLVISNLPYNISVPLLLKILGGPNPPRQAVLMFQKEVGDRIVARFGGKSYGSLSVAVSLMARATPLFSIRPGAFHPPPKVQSVVLSFTPRDDRGDPAFPGAMLLARGAFGYRRKTLRNAFSQAFSPAFSNLVAETLEMEPGLSEKRPEQVPPETWVALSRRLIEHSPKIFDTISRSD